MAFDKVVDSAVLESGLTSIANAIREKAGASDALAFPAGFAEAIAAIESGGGDVKVAYGTITPDTGATNILITHNLGVVPFLGVFCKMLGSLNRSKTEVIASYQENSNSWYTYLPQSTASLSSTSFSMSLTTSYTNYTLNRANANTVYSPGYIHAGNTYFWLVMG